MAIHCGMATRSSFNALCRRAAAKLQRERQHRTRWACSSAFRRQKSFAPADAWSAGAALVQRLHAVKPVQNLFPNSHR